MFLDVFDLKYLTRNHNNNNNNNNNNNHDDDDDDDDDDNNKNKKNIWHLVSLVRADPAAERREYNVCKIFGPMSIYFCKESLEGH